MPEKIKVLMTLHGMWPIHIHRKYSPIELEPGISLVCIDGESFEDAGEFKVQVHEKGEIEMRPAFSNHPLSKLPKMGLLFELQERDEDNSFLYMPHKYVGASMRPRTILRLFRSGEFITSLIINELGFDICTPTSDDPDLIHYEIEPQTIEPLQNFYQFVLPKFQSTDRNFAARKKLPTFENLRLRLNNAIQFLDKSYFAEFGFQRSIGVRPLDTPRNDNYLRHIFCWLGIESLTCYGKDDKTLQLKTHIRHFLPEYSEHAVSTLVDTHYDRRSGYIHADPNKMHRILNRDLETVRDVLKQLIMVYLLICSDEGALKELGRKGNGINPVKGLTQMDVAKYFAEMKDGSGADFESYVFWVGHMTK